MPEPIDREYRCANFGCMETIKARQKKRTHNVWVLFGLGTMIMGAFLLLTAFPSKRGKGPFRSY
jgi:hypothetical protein